MKRCDSRRLWHRQTARVLAQAGDILRKHDLWDEQTDLVHCLKHDTKGLGKALKAAQQQLMVQRLSGKVMHVVHAHQIRDQNMDQKATNQ